MPDYALLFNTDQEDYDPKPVCHLFDAPDDRGAIIKGMEILLDDADADIQTISTEALLREYVAGHEQPPRVVALRTVGYLDAETPGIEDLREHLTKETKEREARNKARLDREQDERDRREYERLKAKFNPKGY